MSDLRDLYQEVILDHNKKPRNFREIENTASQADGHNPLCGDNVTVFVELDGETVKDVSFLGNGCAISKASASLMTESVKGKTKAEAEQIFKAFHDMVTGKAEPGTDTKLGKLAALSGVSEFPVRVKCATLAWHTLQAAITGEDEPVSTE